MQLGATLVDLGRIGDLPKIGTWAVRILSVVEPCPEEGAMDELTANPGYCEGPGAMQAQQSLPQVGLGWFRAAWVKLTTWESELSHGLSLVTGPLLGGLWLDVLDHNLGKESRFHFENHHGVLIRPGVVLAQLAGDSRGPQVRLGRRTVRVRLTVHSAGSLKVASRHSTTRK